MEQRQVTLKELRARYGMTMKDVADQLGVSVPAYSHWEKDFGQVRIRHAKKLADIFHVDINDIFFGNTPYKR